MPISPQPHRRRGLQRIARLQFGLTRQSPATRSTHTSFRIPAPATHSTNKSFRIPPTFQAGEEPAVISHRATNAHAPRALQRMASLQIGLTRQSPQHPTTPSVNMSFRIPPTFQAGEEPAVISRRATNAHVPSPLQRMASLQIGLTRQSPPHPTTAQHICHSESRRLSRRVRNLLLFLVAQPTHTHRALQRVPPDLAQAAE